LTDAICVEGIRRAARSLRRAFDDSTDKSAREDMALASLLGGLALANAGLGAVHGFAAPIGGKFSAPHGAVCAALLPHVMQANLIALHAREPRALALRRYDEVARLLTSSDHAGAAEGVGWVEHLCAHVQIPPLRRYGITSSDFPALVEGARNASSMKANPIPLVDDEMIEILGRAW
jgi:alcohol dehydrogenase class IV